MKTLPLRFFVLGLIAALPFSAINASAASESAATSLFDGKTLTGWRGYKTTAPAEAWKVIDGSIVLKGKGGDLVTVAEYGDFDLSFEWKVTETANSGVIYRVGLGETASYVTGPEYQVLDNEKAEDNKKQNHLAASLYDIVLKPSAKTKAVGEWNTGRIRVRGWHVEHWLNGEQVVDIDLAAPEGKALIAASKFKDWKKFASLPRGHIALQDHGHEVSFRAITIRELK